jgi:hypothetical protein
MNRAGITGLLMALLESRLRVDCCELIFFGFLEGGGGGGGGLGTPPAFFIRQPRKQTERFHMVLILMGPLSFTRLA